MGGDLTLRGLLYGHACGRLDLVGDAVTVRTTPMMPVLESLCVEVSSLG